MDDQIEVVERSVRTIKEIIMIMVNATPFRRVPKFLVKRLVKVATRNLNIFPLKVEHLKDSDPFQSQQEPQHWWKEVPSGFWGARQ